MNFLRPSVRKWQSGLLSLERVLSYCPWVSQAVLFSLFFLSFIHGPVALSLWHLLVGTHPCRGSSFCLDRQITDGTHVASESCWSWALSQEFWSAALSHLSSPVGTRDVLYNRFLLRQHISTWWLTWGCAQFRSLFLPISRTRQLHQSLIFLPSQSLKYSLLNPACKVSFISALILFLLSLVLLGPFLF